MDLRIESLNPLFNPGQIAVIGATPDLTRIGGRPIMYLLEAGYQGGIHPVNPKYDHISGLPCYAKVSDVPGEVDLAVIALPGPLVRPAIEDCAAKGVSAAIIFSAGFAETGEAGARAEKDIVDLARSHGMRVLGPNCLGMFNVSRDIYTTFSIGIQTGRPKKGRLGFVTQSGAFGSHVFSLAREQQVGLSYWMATGNEADVDVADCIAFLASDPGTDVIACYIEGCKDGEKLLAAFEAARANRKPVIMLKVGRTEAGRRAALSHTAALVGDDEVYQAVFRQKGVYRARTIEEFMDVASACTLLPFPQGDRIAVFTVSGGVGILMADQIAENGLHLPETPQEVQKRLLEVLPFAAVENPIDVTGQIVNQPTLLRDFMDIVLGSGAFDMSVSFLAHGGLSVPVMENQLAELGKVRAKHPRAPFIMSTLVTPETKRMISEAGFAAVEDPSRAVTIISALYYFKRSFDDAGRPDR
ncbi:MAG: CoA-binding protein [Proteobacteria bacterium]|nr:CoA-binding protein [Pseudomonadota bacterium]